MAIPAKPGKPTPVVIKDQDGTVLLRTTVVDNRSYVLIGEGRGMKLVAAGLVYQTAPVSYQGTAIVSARTEMMARVIVWGSADSARVRRREGRESP